MNNRIKALRKNLGLSQDTFADKLGLTKNYISLVENGNRNLSEQSIKVLCSIFNVNEDWIRYGKGNMFLDKSKDEEIAEMLADIQLSGEDSFKHRLVSALSKLNEDEWNMLEKLIDDISSK